MEQTKIADWREDITEPKSTLKIADGQYVAFGFLDEGKKISSADYGDSIVFNVRTIGDNEEKSWYVNAKNYELLKQIKELGVLTGKVIEVHRKGSKKSDTRYTINTNVNLD